MKFPGITEPFVVDTNVVIHHAMSSVPGLVSAVVLQELTSGARDDADLRRLGTARATAERGGTLLTPDGDDWYQAGKVLYSLLKGKRSRRVGWTPAIDRGEQQRLLRDVLIARSAKRAGAAVVTYNNADFEKIRRFCDVKVVVPEVLS